MTVMSEGYSLTAAAGRLGLSRKIVDSWIATHSDFADSVERGQAMRIYCLEREIRSSDREAVIRARERAILSAVLDEQQIKQEQESPLSILARELSGTAIRPKDVG
jgi:transposase-like protein